MPVVDYATTPEFPMRAGITGAWVAGGEQGATSLSILANTAQPGAVVPRHFHEYEEVVLVVAGGVWVEIGDEKVTAHPGQSVVLPPRTPHAWGVVGPGPARILFVWSILEPFAPGKSTYVNAAPPAVS
jgi:quercetin dioxygenase-like cupin family protein